jgi:hypothetical protein
VLIRGGGANREGVYLEGGDYCGRGLIGSMLYRQGGDIC